MVYQIPPASSSSGHKADDWKKCIWRGRCRIVGKGQDLYIKLLDSSSGDLFAQCLIPKGEHELYVERVVDSSRYFVLKITNGQRHAFIGLGFEDRNDAFDFNCTLSDFKSTWVEKEKPVEAVSSQGPAKDLSLREGQKITINIKGVGGTRKREESGEAAGGGFGGILAPPPSGGSVSRRQAAPAPLAPPPVTVTSASISGPGQTGLGAAWSSQPAPSAQPASDHFFADFDDFQSAPAAPAGSSNAPAQTLTSQFGQMSLGGATPAPAALTQAPLGGAVQPSLVSQAHAAQKPARPPQGQRDPFDEFDIFK